MAINTIVQEVTNAIKERSRVSYQNWLTNTISMVTTNRKNQLSCGNMAHVVASSPCQKKQNIIDGLHSNVAIISAYNDMLSAHQPYAEYPNIIDNELKKFGHTSQVAGCTPAMCDGITQGQPGMELSLFSRDIIAQSTAISLSHNAFNATLLLSICDKVAPGQLMGALSFAHLPTAFIPAGPMSTGITNDEKVAIRQDYAAGKADRKDLLKMECAAYHSPGTCTFYGTANTNQLVFEAMGLMLPGSAFVAHNSPLRTALTKEAAIRLASLNFSESKFKPLYKVFTPESLVNGVIAWLASGGSTNHSLHLVAIAKCAGITLTWQDIDRLSSIVPLLVRMYPNGPLDINDFHAAGGVPVLMKELHRRGLLNTNVSTAFDKFETLFTTPVLKDGNLEWEPCVDSLNHDVISGPGSCFETTGGIKILDGNIGKAVIKVSAIEPQHQHILAPARVFVHQDHVEQAYHNNELNQDLVIVVKHNGPAANGMPELHKLMPILGNLQKSGYKVALVTDGRLSGASGKIPAAIHVTPEAERGGMIGRVRDGDIIALNAKTGELSVIETTEGDLYFRDYDVLDTSLHTQTYGRNLFTILRKNVSSADTGATIF